MNRLGFFDPLGFVCIRQGDELEAGCLGLGDLISILLSGQHEGLGALLFNDLNEDYLQVCLELVEPVLFDRVDEEFVDFVDLGELLGDGELFGDVANERRAIKTVDDAGLQWPRPILPMQSPLTSVSLKPGQHPLHRAYFQLGDDILLVAVLRQRAAIQTGPAVRFIPAGVTDVVAVRNALNNRMRTVRQHVGVLGLRIVELIGSVG